MQSIAAMDREHKILMGLVFDLGLYWRADRLRGGYPRRNPIGRLIDEGPGAGHLYAAERPLPYALAVLDRDIASLPTRSRKVLRLRADVHRDSPMEVMAKRIGCHPSTLRRWISRALDEIFECAAKD